MAIDRYRSQNQQISDQHKRSLLERVVEQRQVDPSEFDEHERILSGRQSQSDRLPDWFAD